MTPEEAMDIARGTPPSFVNDNGRRAAVILADEVERLQEEVEKGINHALELRSEMGKRDAEITRLQSIVELHYLKRYRLEEPTP